MHRFLPLFVLVAACTTTTFNTEKILGLGSELSASQSFDKITKAPTDVLCRLAIVRMKNNQYVPFTVSLDEGEVSLLGIRLPGDDGDVYGNFAMNELTKRISAMRDNSIKACITNAEWLSELPLSRSAEKECGYAFFRNTSPNDVCMGNYNGTSFEDEILNVSVKKSSISDFTFNPNWTGPVMSCTTREGFGGTSQTTCY